MGEDTPQGFILSDAALYAFQDQDVFPDLISFCSAIPYHLRPLFLIPIKLQPITASVRHAARRVASFRVADGAIPSGGTEEGGWFGTKTFVYDDVEPTIPSSDPGSIHEPNEPDDLTRHQNREEEQDQNWQDPTDTSYMSDVDVTDSGYQYPYRTEEAPVRHSSILVVRRLALTPEDLEARAPGKVRDNAESCSVRLISYDKRGRVYTFSVSCAGSAKTVRAALTDLDHVAMSCDCPFWRWNGPEFHASENSYMLGQPRGTASPPDVRDPDRSYWLCKHAYAVLARLDNFVGDVIGENQDRSEEELLETIDQNWDNLEEEVEIPIEEAEEEDVELEWEKSAPEDEEEVDESFEEAPAGDESEEESEEESFSEEEPVPEEEPEEELVPEESEEEEAEEPAEEEEAEEPAEEEEAEAEEPAEEEKTR